jgi:hypothetical protein|tara:strand:+ start:286 stop:465 length:180 start_codon:yes stop_codon:yes gene_type:complete
MSESASRVYDAVTEGGMSITPDAIVAAIRCAAMECKDDKGNVSLVKLYELTCELENITL